MEFSSSDCAPIRKEGNHFRQPLRGFRLDLQAELRNLHGLQCFNLFFSRKSAKNPTVKNDLKIEKGQTCGDPQEYCVESERSSGCLNPFLSPR
jgi:hypothetical protein